jgi:addiction module HigA family antidote
MILRQKVSRSVPSLSTASFTTSHRTTRPAQRINEIVRGKRGVTPETAWLLADAFDTTPEFWLNLQAAHDLATHRPARRIPRLRRAS